MHLMCSLLNCENINHFAFFFLGLSELFFKFEQLDGNKQPIKSRNPVDMSRNKLSKYHEKNIVEKKKLSPFVFSCLNYRNYSQRLMNIVTWISYIWEKQSKELEITENY